MTSRFYSCWLFTVALQVLCRERSAIITLSKSIINLHSMSADAEPHSVEVSHPEEGITVITINRAKRRNAVNAATATKLYNAIVAYEDDPTAKVAILRGKQNDGRVMACDEPTHPLYKWRDLLLILLFDLSDIH